MEKITLMQKKIITITSIVVLAFLGFWAGVYLPSKKTVSKIKSQLDSVEAQLQEIQTLIGEGKTINESVQTLMERHQQLNILFPRKEEESLRVLSHLTRDLNIELVSIKPQQKKVCLDENRKEIEIEGKIMRTLSVSIGLRCFYKDLAKYLQALRDNLPVFITIERLNIKKGRSDSARLDVTLDVNLYLLS